MLKKIKWKYLAPPLIMFGVWLFIILIAKIEWVAEYIFARGISRALNWLFSRIGGLFPFSIYEWAVILLVLGAIAVIIYGIILISKGKDNKANKLLFALVITLMSVLILFALFTTGGYNRYGLDKGLGFVKAEVNDTVLLEKTYYYISQTNELAEKMKRDEHGNAVAPYDFNGGIKPIYDAYERLQNNGFLSNFHLRPKPVVMSIPMSYTSILGIYMPFSGEVNINTNSMPYERPVVIAHELAHGKGIMPENEANVLAYYVCLNGDDFMRYSALMNITMDLVNEVYSRDKEIYKTVRESISTLVLTEWSNTSKHYAQYDSFIQDISRWVNNLFLKANGVEGGIKSYSNTIRYIVGFSDTNLYK